MSDKAFNAWLNRRGWKIGALTQAQRSTLRAEYDRERNPVVQAVQVQPPKPFPCRSIPMIQAAGEQPEGPLEIVSEPGGITIEAAAGKDGAAAALPKFSMIAYTGGPMRLGGWRYPVVVDLAGLSIPSQQRPIRFGHNPDSGVGHTEAIAIADGKLTASGVISRDTPQARDVVSSSKNGFPWQASIGASVDQFEFVKEDQTATVNGREFKGPLNVVRKSTLGEISFVDIGADGNTSARVAAAGNKQETTMSEFEKWLEAQGFDAKTITAKQRTTLEAAHKAETKASVKAATSDADVDGIIAAAKARRERTRQIAAIIEAAASIPGADLDALDEMAAKAAAENMAVTDVELAALRLTRPKPPSIRGRSPTPADTQSVLTAATLMATGYDGNELVKAYGEPAVADADKQYGHTIRLKELILACAKANGYVGREDVNVGNWDKLVSIGRGHGVQASGYSTVDLTGILGAVANKALAKQAASIVWLAPRIAGTASHANFHSHTVYSMAVNGELLPVGPTGELKHLSLSEESYTRQIGTKGGILRISRQNIIDDELGVFQDNATNLARNAFMTRERALFTKIMASAAGSSHFTAARGNYISGATTALSNTGLDLAVAAFRGLTGANGDPIMVEPSILLVPKTLEGAAKRLLAATSSLIVSRQSNADATPSFSSDNNIYAGQYGGAPLVSPFLEITTITGNSAAYWYLLAAPGDMPCYTISYLNGNETPTVQYFGLDSESDTLGMTWRAFWDFGVDTAEWRAGVKSAGA